MAGIGCHFMASWMNRNTTSLIQMGGEGVNWVARAKFNGNKHIFQNLGEGTYYHSGSLAVRQAIAAGTNITYKILFNDAVAMTGGQGVDGPVTVEAIAHSMVAEGARKVVVISDHPEQFRPADFPTGVPIEHRRELDRIQRELREIPGTTVLIYQQTCATEKRRLRKRGKLEDPKRFAVINPLVCEGCGDCSVESNCLSVEPLETEFGRKRKINLNSCNKDFTCLNGFCPSFVTVEGGTPRKSGAGDRAALEEPFWKSPRAVDAGPRNPLGYPRHRCWRHRSRHRGPVDRHGGEPGRQGGERPRLHGVRAEIRPGSQLHPHVPQRGGGEPGPDRAKLCRRI